MEIIVTEDYEEMSDRAAEIFIDEIAKNPEIVLGLATGSSPEGLYKRLIKSYQKGEIDFSRVKTFNLDEYVGLSEEDETSYRYFMNHHLFNHINIKDENINIPDGKTEDLEAFCLEYDRILEEAGGIDLQLLGLGEDGHIAFNEPAEFLNTETHITQLAESTIEVNSRFFDSIDQVPRTAITLGMAGIMRARRIVLIASGPKKYDAMNRFLNEKKVCTDLPVSFLRLHPNVTVIVDKEAYEGE